MSTVCIESFTAHVGGRACAQHGLQTLRDLQVACGVSHTLFLVDADEKQLEPFEVFEPETAIEDEPKPAVKHGALRD